MSWLSDFDKLHISTKSVSISLSALLPFWLISIYLFKRPLYDTGDYLIIGAFVIAFSISYYLLRFSIAFALWLLDDSDSDFELMVFGITGVGCFVNLCFWIIIGYSFDFAFFTFVIWLFSIPTVLTIVLYSILLYRDEKKEQEKAAAESDQITEDYPVGAGGGDLSSSSLPDPNVE